MTYSQLAAYKEEILKLRTSRERFGECYYKRIRSTECGNSFCIITQEEYGTFFFCKKHLEQHHNTFRIIDLTEKEIFTLSII